MSPDIPYYVPVPVDAGQTHSLAGVVGVDVLLGLGVFLVFHGFLARPAIALAPAAARARLPVEASAGLRARMPAPRRVLLVLLSLSAGAATHLVWDAFTHNGRWGTAHLPWLAAQHGLLPGYRWAQYGSGLFGALAVGLWLVRWWRSTEAAPSASGLRPAVAAGAWVSVLVAGAAGAVAGSVGALTSPQGPDLSAAVFLAVTRGTALAAFVLLLLAASWHVGLGRRG
jgi:hypothetical protein